MTLLLIYLFIINIISYTAMYIDKQKAINNKYRISENTLISLSLIGGSIGTLSGMYNFRHKTQKPKFKIGIPLIILIQIVITYFI
ncbi:MAG: DUF1294 domain-containing protein [Peptostreptococcaceae bacterium]